MKVETFPIAGPLLLTPAVYADERGWFSESWNRRRFAEALGLAEADAPEFVQDNHSRSVQGVLRGLHFQREPHPQGKLVRCTLGEVFDVAVDLRQGSPTLGQWVGVRLSAGNRQPALGAGGLRPRLPDAERRGRGAVQDRRLLEPRLRTLPGLERPRRRHRLAPGGAAGAPPAPAGPQGCRRPRPWRPWRRPAICSPDPHGV